MEKILEVSKLIKVYNRKTVLDIPELSIYRGQIFGIAGNNGAGKTTFFRLLLDLIKPSEGSVLMVGENVAQSEDWKRITGSFLDEGFLIPHLSPEEYFGFVGKTRGLSKGELSLQLKSFESLFNGEVLRSGKYIRDLSQGNRKKVGIASALLGKPELIVLDEPFASLDPSSQFELKSMLSALSINSGATLLISSHNLHHLAGLCNRIAIIHHGKIIRDIQSDEHTQSDLEKFFASKV